VVCIGSTAQSLKDLKGAKIMFAPGPANLEKRRQSVPEIRGGPEEGKDYNYSVSSRWAYTLVPCSQHL
jgi:hypothetical protein